EQSWNFNFSPDGSKIVYGGYSGLFIMNSDGNNKRSLISGNNPAWSPDGKWIAYSNQDGIAIISPSGTNTQLTGSSSMSCDEIRWSNDSTKIFCLTNNHELWSIDIGTTNVETQLNFPQSDIWEFSLLPDGNTVVYDNLANIYSLNLTGTSAPSALTANLLPGIVYTPKWSPDGNLVAYCAEPNSQADGLDWGSGIKIVAKEGGDSQEIVSQVGWIEDIVWSPDGEKIAYEVYGDSGPNLWMVSKSGTGNTQLTTSEMAYNCSFSPAGDEIVYSGGGIDQPYGLWRMNLNAGTKTFLTEGHDPAWSPDGNKIAFISHSGEGLLTIPSSGGTPATLTTTQGAQNPVWSPGSSMIAYTVGNEIWVIGHDGQNNRKIYTAADYIWSSLCFSPDSQYIAFSDDMNVYTIKIDGSGINKINPADTIAWDVDWSSQNMLVYSGIGSGGAASAPTLKKMAAPKGNTSKAPPLYKASETPQQDSRKRGADIYAIPMGAPGDTGTITGSINYSGTKTGTLRIGVFNNPEFSGEPVYRTKIPTPVFPQSYAIPVIGSATYYVGAYLDTDNNDTASLGDIIGIYGTLSAVYLPWQVIGTPDAVYVEEGSLTTGIDFYLTHEMQAVPSGTITGSINYSGTKTGTLRIGVFNNPEFPGEPVYRTKIPTPVFPQSYAIPVIGSATYYVGAYLDTDNNDTASLGDIIGIYGTLSAVYLPWQVIGTPDAVYVEEGSLTTGIDFYLTHEMQAVPSGTITGSINYSGTKTGTLR
ncbi:MAG: hypothetical protein QME49_09335, partial [bacterium]|nr:hypothetical protein [bacterium]